MPRITIRLMMLLVVFAAIITMVMRDHLPVWATAMFWLTLAALSGSLVIGLSSSGRKRAGWLAMGVFGLAYLHAACQECSYPRLGTTDALDWIGTRTPTLAKRRTWISLKDGRGVIIGENINVALKNEARYRLFPSTDQVDLAAYRQVGHSILSLLVGLAAGCTALFLTRDRQRPEGGTPWDAAQSG